MKLNTLKNRWVLPALGCALLASASRSEAAVIVYFEEVGPDVVATWTGSLLLQNNWTNDYSYGSQDGVAMSDTLLYRYVEDYENFFGTASLTSIMFIPTIDASTFGGGFSGSSFSFPGIDDNTSPGAIFINFDAGTYEMTFLNDTLANIGASSFNNTLAWTSENGDTISYTTIAVPEPSSTLLIGLGAIGFMIRRRR